MISRMNLLKYHRFFGSLEPIDIDSEEYRASASNMPRDLFESIYLCNWVKIWLRNRCLTLFSSNMVSLWEEMSDTDTNSSSPHTSMLETYLFENFMTCLRCHITIRKTICSILSLPKLFQMEKDGYEYSKIEVPTVVAALQSDVESREVALWGVQPRILKKILWRKIHQRFRSNEV